MLKSAPLPHYVKADPLSSHHNGATFTRAAEASGIGVLRTAYRAPKENAICERFLGSVRRASGTGSRIARKAPRLSRGRTDE